MTELSGRGEKSGIVPAVVLLGCVVAILITQLTIAATSNGSDDMSSRSSDNQLKEVQDYKKWTKVNSVPQLMLDQVAIACGIWLLPTGGEVHGDANPHVDKYFTVYVNDIGREAMRRRNNRKFPAGSVIVKEKLPDRLSQMPELLTVMIKQKKGFNKATGDWEYMVTDGTGTEMRARGNLQNCQSCHIAKQKGDYVFQTYPSDGLEPTVR